VSRYKETIILGVEDTLTECTNSLLRNPDKMREWLAVADKHMQTYAEDKKNFLLPRAHEFLEPLILTYANNLEGFTEYLVGLRDRFDRSSAAFKDMQAIYRRVNGRYIQQQRRERMERATEKAEELYGKIPYMQRVQWAARLEHEWAKRRLDFLDAHRRKYENDRLPAEDRVELLAEFWEGIDNEIHEGRIPNWNSTNHGATPP
jgi:hypothetical protein